MADYVNGGPSMWGDMARGGSVPTFSDQQLTEAGPDFWADMARASLVSTGIYYVNSVSGNDGYDGKSPNSAFQSLGMIPFADGIVINLARGSVFKEQLNGSAFNNISLGSYGSGSVPVIDASDICPSDWVVDEELENVYNQTLGYSSDFGHYLSMWEDGARLLWVDDKATCDTTPGSWTIEGNTDGLTTVDGEAIFSIHPYGSTIVGKVFEYSAREYGLFTGDNWNVSSIRARRQINNNGSLILGSGTIANGCIAEDGVKHNAFGDLNSVFNNCIAWKCDYPSRIEMAAFVAFATDASGSVAQFNNCVVLFEDDKFAYAAGNDIALGGISAHADGEEGHNWQLIQTTGCSFRNTTTALGVVDVDQYVSTRDFSDGGTVAFSLGAIVNVAIDPYIRERDNVTVLRAITVPSEATTVVNGLRIYRKRGGADVFSIAAGEISVENSVFCRDAGVNNHIMVNSSGTATVNMNGNIFYMDRTGGNDSYSFNLPDDPAGTIDHNVHASNPLTEAKVEIGGTEYWYQDYVVDFPQFDATSSEANPLLNDPENGDFGVSGASPANAIGAGLLRPDVQYTPIPTHEQVEAM